MMPDKDSTANPEKTKPAIKTVCVDLDGVLAAYDGWKGVGYTGPPIPGAKQFIEAIQSLPAKVCIWTVRTNVLANRDSGLGERELRLLVEDWLVKHGIPFDSIACGEGKPLAAAYVDDRAVCCRPMKDIETQDYDTALRLCAALVSGHELGAQGTHSQGKVTEDDEGDIKLMISSTEGIVRIDFGKPVAWLGLPTQDAFAMANTILKHVRNSR